MTKVFEATIEKRDRWYISWVDAVPGAFSQGRTIKEVEENLKEAVQLIFETHQELESRLNNPSRRIPHSEVVKNID